MGFVVKRGENYSARLAIPKALRPILGRNEFKKSLGTTSKKEAELLAAPLGATLEETHRRGEGRWSYGQGKSLAPRLE